MSLEVRPRITPFLRRLSKFEIAFWIAWFAQHAISTLAFYAFYPIAGQEACSAATAGTTQKTEAPACVGNRL